MTNADIRAQIEANDQLLAQLNERSAQARAANTQAYYRILKEQRLARLAQDELDWAEFERELDAYADADHDSSQDVVVEADIPF